MGAGHDKDRAEVEPGEPTGPTGGGGANLMGVVVVAVGSVLGVGGAPVPLLKGAAGSTGGGRAWADFDMAV